MYFFFTCTFFLHVYFLEKNWDKKKCRTTPSTGNRIEILLCYHC